MFAGWFIKIGNTEFPMKYIKATSYKARPDQRLDSSAERDMTGELHRDVVEHKPTKIEFETMPLTNVKLAEIRAIFDSAWEIAVERKLSITYYNNETDTYKTGMFYMPDAEYTISGVRGNVILYEPVRYAFIEY